MEMSIFEDEAMLDFEELLIANATGGVLPEMPEDDFLAGFRKRYDTWLTLIHEMAGWYVS